MATLNEELNPTRMTPETREKIREARLKMSPPKQSTYLKIYGRHVHRIVAEDMLGRALEPGEVVHHKDGDRHNNDPTNLEVLPSASAHASLHASERRRQMLGGDPDRVPSEEAPAAR